MIIQKRILMIKGITVPVPSPISHTIRIDDSTPFTGNCNRRLRINKVL